MNCNQLDLHAVFCAAIELNSPDEVRHFLDEACEGNATLRAAVEDLLSRHDDNGGFLGGIVGKDNAWTNHAPGTAIGPYELCERIGEGGMGVVYVAQQTEPVRRKVALKLIRSEAAGKDVERRFEAERQTLALMEHPHIASVFDGGMTDSGQPYFVMELVQGLSLVEFCDEHRLSVRERLHVFLQVCRAVEHAHQKGIIHRDLKPSNVLVKEIDGAPVPKVIDFGVAKAVSDELTVQTACTNIAQIVGTPLYMSPEQASMGVVDVDTRSDVYSLGVLLYELLTGAIPFDSATLRQAGFDEMRRIIREDEPRRPSTMVGTLENQTLSTVATCRGTDARQLKTSLRGELDWLVLKALEKDRDRRYGSAMALADDIKRFLNDQPILARPTSLAYRFNKFVQRNRARLIPASVVASVLLIGLTMALVAVVRERNEKQTAWSELGSLQDETARRLYASQMVQASGAWEDRDYASLEQLLESAAPETAESPDFRGWEWHFLNEQLRRPFAAIPGKRVYQTAWHPRRNEIAVVVEQSKSDSSIEIWKPGVQLPVRIVTVVRGIPASKFRGFTWSGRENRIALTTQHGRAIVLDAETGGTLFDRQVHTGKGDKSEVWGVSLSPTEDILATASFFGQIKFWDINTQQLVEVFIDPPDADYVSCIAFSPDGQHLLATLRFGKRATWDLKTKTRVDYDRLGNGSLGQLEWSADGKRFVATDEHKVAVYDCEVEPHSPNDKVDDDQRPPTFVLKHREVSDVCWVNDNGFASCGTDQTVRIWDRQQGTMVRSLRVNRGPLWQVAASSDGQFLGLRGRDGLSVMRLTNHVDCEILQPTNGRGGTSSIVRWSRNGRKIAVKPRLYDGSDYRASIRIYDLGTSSVVAVHNNTSYGHLPMMCWSVDGTRVLDVDPFGCCYYYGVDDPTIINVNNDVQRIFKKFRHLALNQEMGLLAVAGDAEVRICELGNLSTVDRLALKEDIWSVRLAWSPDNRSLLIVHVIDETIHIQVYDLLSQKTVTLPPIANRDDPVVTWDPTSTRVAIGTDHAEVHIRSVTHAEQHLTLVGHTSRIREVSWSPNGSRIASCAGDGTVRIWDTDRGDQLAVFHASGESTPGESTLFCSVQWSPDGRRLAASTVSGGVFLLDAGPSMASVNLSDATN